MSEHKVLIIGAGLGGLVLAHILHKNNIPFDIFERDAQISSRAQGWAVVLVECLPYLKEALPDVLVRDLYANSVNHNTGDLDEIGFVHALTGEKIGSIGGVPRGQDGHVLRVSRLGLRNFLLQNGDLPVSLGKQFTHYEEQEGSVAAFFKDGTSTSGSLLVGADGAHSGVMNQLVGTPNHRPVPSKWVPIFGQVKLPPKHYEPLRKLGSAVVLAAAPGVRTQIGMLHMEPDKSTASYFWAVSPRQEDPEALATWVQNATQKELYDRALEITQGQHPVIADVIRFGGPEALVRPQPRFLEYVTPEDMPKGRVTALGDAAHAMVPFRGAGANTAILDACELGGLIVRAHQAQKDSAGVVGEYLKTMIPRGREMVLSSRAAGEHTLEEWVERFQRQKKSAGEL